MVRPAVVVVLGLLFAACSSDGSVTTSDSSTPSAPASASADESVASEELYPDVIEAEASQDSDGTWRFDVTLSSPYDSPQRYADGWRVLAPDGTELGVRVLGHDHAAEQPFTRTLSGVNIPAGVDSVTIEGRDQVSGWGGATVEVTLLP